MFSLSLNWDQEQLIKTPVKHCIFTKGHHLLSNYGWCIKFAAAVLDNFWTMFIKVVFTDSLFRLVISTKIYSFDHIIFFYTFVEASNKHGDNYCYFILLGIFYA